MAFYASHVSPLTGRMDASWPTINQLAAIGSVVTTWSWLDLTLEAIMATLVQSPDEMLSQALTEDLGPDNRLKAIRRLINTWVRVAPKIEDDQRLALCEAQDVLRWISQNKAKRNKIAHWLWVRQTDEILFGWKHHQAPDTQSEIPNITVAVDELLDFAKEIGDRTNQLSQAELKLRNLPRWHPLSPLTGFPLHIKSLLGPYRCP